MIEPAVLHASLVFEYDDGGREAAGYKGQTGDCVVRAATIVSGLPYKQVYQLFKKENPHGVKLSHYAKGVSTDRLDAFLRERGFRFRSTVAEIGEIPQYVDASLPMGKLVVLMNHHVFAVINHVIHDTYDAHRGGVYRTRVAGYWKEQSA